jgi:hypothetical protein
MFTGQLFTGQLFTESEQVTGELISGQLRDWSDNLQDPLLQVFLKASKSLKWIKNHNF